MCIGCPSGSFGSSSITFQRTGYPVFSWRDFPAAAAAPGMKIALTFEDGYRSDLDCARLLHSLGYDALFFIATDYLRQTGYLQREM
jgi:hypothetical protein